MEKTTSKKEKSKMCDCLETVEKKAFDHIKAGIEKNFTIASVNEAESHFQRRALSFGDNGGWRLYFEYQFVHTLKKKNGEDGRETKKVVSIYPTFCPFCGKKYPQ